MSNFWPHVTIEGVQAQVNFDNIIYIIANDAKSSLIYFQGGETLLIKGRLNPALTHGDSKLIDKDFKILRDDQPSMTDLDGKQGAV